MTESMQYVGEITDACWHLHIFPGADAAFSLYEDAGDGYAYEQGECSRVALAWNDLTCTFTLGERDGYFPSLLTQRAVNLIVHSGATPQTRTFQYTGREMVITFDPQQVHTSHA
jgi:alpha-D-xyloside xylohydrolase